MKIAFFSPTLNVGGYERVVLAFANYFAEEEHEVTIVCGNSEGKLHAQISKKVKVVDLNCRTKTLVFKLSDYFRKNSPEFFYCGFRIYNSIAIVSRIISGNNMTKIVISQHGYEYQNLFKINFHKIIQSKADALITVTQSLLVFESETLKLTCPMIAIGNPVIEHKNIQLISKEAWFDDMPVLCTCGRLSQDKNFSLAIDIIKYLHDMGRKCKLLILGDGPERGKLEGMVERYSLKSYVRFEGFVSEPIKYMSQCHIYLHTCDREGFGNTVVEAMYANLPIITTDCGGPVDIIENGKYGICFGNGRDNNAAIRGAQAVIDILDNKISISNLKEKALTYSVDCVAERMITFLKKL